MASSSWAGHGSGVPKESAWTRDVCKKLVGAGAVVVANVMGTMTSHHPDRTVTFSRRGKKPGNVRIGGNFYVEFKGQQTKLRPGQQLLIKNMNSRWPCAFIYRWPNVLTLEAGGVVYQKDVDALEHPHLFLESLLELHMLALDKMTT